MKRIGIFAVALILAASCLQIELRPEASSPTEPNVVHATISVKQSQFDLARGDEVDITFAVSNATTHPIPGPAFCNATELLIDDQVLADSSFIFSNGLPPVDKDHMFPPGGKHLFLYRLTRYFNKKGVYHVSWRGEYFKTEPLVFEVVSTREQ